MRKSKFFFFVICFTAAFHFSSFAQDEAKLIKMIPADARTILCDAMDNWYIITNQEELKKYDSNGVLLYTYRRKGSGKIGSIDINNPLRITLYYPDFYILVSLDNTLSVLNEYSLEQFNRNLVVAPASGNAYWLYDPASSELQKLNSFSSAAQKISNIFQQTGYQVLADRIVERNKLLYFHIPEEGLVITDEFGTYLHKVPLNIPSYFQIDNSVISYYASGKWHSYDQSTLKSTEWTLPAVQDEVVNATLYDKHLYILGKKAVFLYRLP